MAQKIYGDYPEEEFKFSDDPESCVTIKQASFGAERRRSAAFTTGKVSWVEGTSEMTQWQETSAADARALEIWLTFVESNLLGTDDKPLFALGKGEAEFMEALDKLPHAVVMEWYGFVLEMNPDWGPKRDRQEKPA